MLYIQIKKGGMGGAFRMHGEMRNAYGILVGEFEGKRTWEI
jgi:hypothetical protein